MKLSLVFGLIAVEAATLLGHAWATTDEGGFPALTSDEERVVHGELQLIRLELTEKVYEKKDGDGGDSYEGQVKGVFCALDFKQQKDDPSKGEQREAHFVPFGLGRLMPSHLLCSTCLSLHSP